jgi:hypothetical protein
MSILIRSEETFQSTAVCYVIWSSDHSDHSVSLPAIMLSEETKPLHRTLFSRSCCHLYQRSDHGTDFVGRTSLVIDIFGMSTEKFVNTLEDVIRSRGAMDKLITTALVSRSPNRLSTSYDHYASMHGRANLTTNTRISPNTDGKPSSATSTGS